MLKFLTVGDPHFKFNNELETNLMEIQVKDIILREKVDIGVVMGDILDKHEKVDMNTYDRAIKFLHTLSEVSPYLYILIGNHDRANNNVFMTTQHVFNSLKKWGPTIKVIDTTTTVEHGGATFIFVPYVPTGRFIEALEIGGHKSPYSGVSCIFAHQEFKGAKMNAITSNVGDEYDPAAPMCISGHIHDYDQLQANLLYVGTPIQHGFADTLDKSLSLFTFDGVEASSESDSEIVNRKMIVIDHRRLQLDIPRKMNFILSAEKLLEFKMPSNTRVKIKVTGDATTISRVIKTQHVQDLIALGVKIKECPDLVVVKPTSEVKLKVGFQTRIKDLIKGTPELQSTFYHLFPNFI
jgi:DNA repair exonuclease SbcCD nuclease subunit